MMASRLQQHFKKGGSRPFFRRYLQKNTRLSQQIDISSHLAFNRAKDHYTEIVGVVTR